VVTNSKWRSQLNSFARLITGAMIPFLLGAEPDSVAAKRNEMFLKALGSPLLIKGGAVEPHWLADGQRFWFRSEVGDPTIFIVDPAAGTKKPFFDEMRLRQALKARTGKADDSKGTLISTFTFANEETKVRFRYADKDWLLTLADYSLVESEEPAEKKPEQPRQLRKGYLDGEAPTYEKASPDGMRFATEKDFNLGIRRAGSPEIDTITTDGTKDYPWVVNQVLWSPDGKHLAVARSDSRKVPRYPVVRWLNPDLPVEQSPATRPGQPIPQYQLVFVDVASKKHVPVVSDKRSDLTLLPIRWTPDGRELLFLRTDRECKTLELVAAAVDTGATRVLVRETADTFVQLPLLGMPTLPIVGNGSQFLWLSERSGWNHLYLYGLDGKLVCPLTKGEFPVMKLVEVDTTNGWVYFSAHDNPERPYDTHICRVNLNGEGFRRLTEAEGQHDTPAYLAALSRSSSANARFSPKKDFFLDTHSSIDRRPRVDLRKADGTFVMTVEEADDSAFRALKLPLPEPFVVKAADGKTDLHGVIYKPFDFDPTRKYAVLDYIYNGPQTIWVPRTYNGVGGLLPLAFAQLGYVTLVVDGRGTTERGKAFQDVVYGKFGQNEVPDHVAVLKQVAATRSWMDLQRVGVFGGSFGGYMTVRAMLTAPDVYKVGVATAPVYDLSDLPVFIESYMGSPARNPEGYEAASCRKLASNLKGKLLVIHGTSDVNAPFSGTLRMVEAFLAVGKHIDLQILPEGTHFPAAGSHQLHYIGSIRRYFEENLKP
jgi:dipeptidyl aminopeptidase/acylaminoacyl peptidase